MRVIVLFFLLAWAAPVVARIGDTPEQAAQRYGPPVEEAAGFEPQHVKKLYRFQDFAILVHYFVGHSRHEYFTRNDRRPLSEAEVQTILTANQFNAKWHHAEGNEVVGWWVYKLGPTLEALRSDTSAFFLVESVEFAKYFKQARAKAEQEKLKGF